MKKLRHLIIFMLLTIFTFANTEFDGLKLRTAGYENKLTISNINSTTVYKTNGNVEQNVKVIFNTNWEGLYVEATTGTTITSDLYRKYIRSMITPELIRSSIVPEIDESTPKTYTLNTTTHQGIDMAYDESKLEGYQIENGKLSEHTSSDGGGNSGDKYDVVFVIGLNHLDTEKTGVDNVQKHLKTFMMSDLASTSFDRINIVEYGAVKFQPNLDMGDRYIPVNPSIGKLDENSGQSHHGDRYFYKNGYHYDLDNSPKDYFNVKELVLRDFNTVSATVNGEYILQNQILGDKNGNSYRLRMYDDWITTSATDTAPLEKALNHVGLLAPNRGSYGTEGGTNSAYGLYYAAKFLVEKSTSGNQKLIVLSDSQIMAPNSFDLVHDFPEFASYLNNFTAKESEFINSGNPSSTLITQRKNAFAFYNWLKNYAKENNILLLASIPLTDINSNLDPIVGTTPSGENTDRLGNPYTDIWDTNNAGNIFHPLMLKAYMADMFYEYESSSKNVTDYENQTHLNDILNHFFGIARFNQSWEFEYTVSQFTHDYFKWKKSIFSLGDFTIPGTTDTAITTTKLVKPGTASEHVEGYSDRYYLPKEGKNIVKFTNPNGSNQPAKFIREEPKEGENGAFEPGALILKALISPVGTGVKIDVNSVQSAEFIIDFDYTNPNSQEKLIIAYTETNKNFTISNSANDVMLKYALTDVDIINLKKWGATSPKKAKFTVNATTLKSGVKNYLQDVVEAMVYLGEPKTNSVVATNITAKDKLKVLTKWNNKPVFDFDDIESRDLALVQATSTSPILYVNRETSTTDNRDEVEIKIDFNKTSISVETFKEISNKVNLTNTQANYDNGTIIGQINIINNPSDNQVDYVLISAQHIKDDYNNIATETPTLKVQTLSRPNPKFIKNLSRDDYTGDKIIINGLETSYNLTFDPLSSIETLAGTLLLFRQTVSEDGEKLGTITNGIHYVVDHISSTSTGVFNMPTKQPQPGSAYVRYDGVYTVDDIALINRAGMFSGISDDNPNSYNTLDLGAGGTHIEYLVDTLPPTATGYTKTNSAVVAVVANNNNKSINIDESFDRSSLDSHLGLNTSTSAIDTAKYFSDDNDKYTISLRDASYTYLSTNGSIDININTSGSDFKFEYDLSDPAGNTTNASINLVDPSDVNGYEIDFANPTDGEKLDLDKDKKQGLFTTKTDINIKVINDSTAKAFHGIDSNEIIEGASLSLPSNGLNTRYGYAIHPSGFAKEIELKIVKDTTINFSGFGGTYVAKEIEDNKAEITIDFGVVTEYAGLKEITAMSSNSANSVAVNKNTFSTYGHVGTSPAPTSDKLYTGETITRTFILDYSSVPSSDTLKITLKDNLGNSQVFYIPIIINTTNIIGTKKDANKSIESSFTIESDGTMSITSQEQKGNN